MLLPCVIVSYNTFGKILDRSCDKMGRLNVRKVCPYLLNDPDYLFIDFYFHYNK